MKLTDYLAQELAKEITHIFVGNGGVVIHILDSLSKSPNITLIPMQTEQGAAIAAESYARHRGLGVAIATSGPGFCNLIQGIACAYYDSIPTLFIIGGVPKGHQKENPRLRQQGFQEMEILDIVKSFTKESTRLNHAQDIQAVLPYLILKAKSGRPGPVVLEIPDDIQRETFTPKIKPVSQWIFEYPVFALDVTYIITQLRKSKKPLIIIGSGARVAMHELKQLLVKFDIPYIPTWGAKDMFQKDARNLIPCGGIAGSQAGNIIIQEADLIIAFGARLDSHLIGADNAKFAPTAQKILLDIDAEEISKFKSLSNFKLIHCNLFKFIPILLGTSKFKKRRCWTSWRGFTLKIKRKFVPNWKSEPYKQFQKLSKTLRPGNIVVVDTGATLAWTMQALDIQVLNIRLYSAFNHSPMGYALPAAIGAGFACPDKQIFCITGDGGLAMNSQELINIPFHKLRIKIIVIDNRGYGIIRQTQDTWLKSNYTCTSPESGLPMPDILALAKAYKVEINVWKIPPDSKIKPKLKWEQSLEEIK